MTGPHAHGGASPDPHTEVVAPDSEATGTEPCPSCAKPRSAAARYCERCGYDFTTGEAGPRSAAPPQGSWTAVVTADRSHFELTAPGGIAFPEHVPSRTFALDGAELTIGRRSASRGIQPTIDLTTSPKDPGVSHIHAALIRAPDGSYSVVDSGSLNGTTINDQTTPIEVDHPVPLDDGDQLHIGAWTTITLHAPSATP